jgi:hypothetical protein
MTEVASTALSTLMEREGLAGSELPADIWLSVITGRVPPKYVELNIQAFNAGREAGSGLS